MSTNIDLIVEEEYKNLRIDKYLVTKIPDKTRSHLQRLIAEENVLVNNKPCKSNYKLSVGDVVSVNEPEAVEANIEPWDYELDIIYEDDDLIIVNKPKGMVVHPAPGHYNDTLVNALMYHCKDNLSSINGILRPGIVHRIDRDTTGSIIVCKNDFSHESIASQLKEHSIKRKYYAIVNGVIKEDSGTIDAPIGRHNVDRKKMAINEKNGREAVTHFNVLRRFKKHTYVECILETGRTHQIRVHMTSIGHPLLGDEVYCKMKCPYKLQGQTLHAGVIGFVHPRTGEYMEFKTELPEYFKNLLNILP